MTVLTRPLPGRIAGNRVVPFVRARYTYRLVPDPVKNWRPPVPEPLEPAPLLGLVTLGLIAAQAFGVWAWGVLNPNRQKGLPPNSITPVQINLRYAPGKAVSYVGRHEGRRHPGLFNGEYVVFDFYNNPTEGSHGSPYTDRAPEFFFRLPEVTHPAKLGTQQYPAVRWYDPRDGLTKVSWFNTGYLWTEQKISISPSSGDSSTWLEFPDGSTTAPFERPGALPQIKPAEFPQIPDPQPQPEIAPPEVLPEVSPVPVQPGPVAPPITVPKVPAPIRQPIPDSTIKTDGGVLVTPGRGPVVVTDPEAHYPWPGSGPITGAGARPDLDAIGKEVGRIEQKVARLFNPPPAGGTDLDRLGLLGQVLKQIWESIADNAPGGEYQISSPCVLDANGNRIPVVVDYPATTTNWDRITARLDAMAELLQAHKDLKQPICAPEKPSLTGEWVTVNFEGKSISPNGTNPLRKILRYRDQSFQSLEVHAAHWHHFEWDAGPVCVIHKNLSWGVPQVWAATAAEGKRILGHAALVAGVDLTDPKGEWIVTHSDSPRVGQPGRMAVRRLRNGALMVSKRIGSAGLPEYPIPT